MTISAREQWYPAFENGHRVPNVLGRFDFMEIEFQERGKDGEAIGEPVIKKVPALICKTTMSPDFVPEKLPVDPIQRKTIIDRFPQAWAAFQGDHVEDIGTPLDREFKGMTLALQERQRYELVGISAWEQIADLSDMGCEQLSFGAKKRRNEVMRAMGRTPPGEVPAVSLSFGMTAEDAIRAIDPKLADALRKAIDQHNDGAPAAAPAGQPDLNHPAVQAAIAAAAEAAAKAAIEQYQGVTAPKRKGWPKGKPRKAGDRLIAAAKEVSAIARGEIVPEPNVYLPADVE